MTGKIIVTGTEVHMKMPLIISAVAAFIIVMALGCAGHIYFVNMFTKARLRHLPKAKKVKVKKGKKKKGKKSGKSSSKSSKKSSKD